MVSKEVVEIVEHFFSDLADEDDFLTADGDLAFNLIDIEVEDDDVQLLLEPASSWEGSLDELRDLAKDALALLVENKEELADANITLRWQLDDWEDDED